MEQLTAKQRESVSKASTRYILNKLINLGEDETAIMELDRNALQKLWAKYLIGEKVAAAKEVAAEVTTGYDPEIERIRIELEREKLQEQKKITALKEKEMAEQKALKEKELKQKELELEVRRQEIRAAEAARQAAEQAWKE